MKNKIGIIILFVIQAIAIPFALFAGLMLLFIVVSFVEIDWSQMDVVIQSVVALITTLIGVLYIGTYIFSLIKTLDNKNNLTVGSASISSYLSAIEMQYITATEFSSLLTALGLHAGITMS
ncbi:MAG: hypothetical protein IJC74_07355, partial [Clostridia bacterium]|nr:hypothetical protein [Clostridia bacterium]